jgi:hypothetical protein
LLPNALSIIEEAIYGDEYEFVKECYPGNKRKDDLGEKERERLCTIFKDVAYKEFIESEATLENIENEVLGDEHE